MLRRRDESGNVMVCLAIILILTTLAFAGLARTLATLKASKANQDFNANLSNADSALSDILFRLDQGATGTLNSAAGEPSFRYHATPVASAGGVDSYNFKAVGTVNGRPHAISATLTRRRRFPYAIYTRHDIDLAAAGTSPICGLFDPVSGYFPALVGASGKITLASGATGPPPTPTSTTAACGPSRGGDGQDTFAPSGVCVNCYSSTSVYRAPDSLLLPATQAPILTDVTTSPVGATVRCSFAGAIAGGNYVCTGDLTFTADATVPQTGPPVAIYELNGGNLDFSKKNVNYPTLVIATPTVSGATTSVTGGTLPAGKSYYRVTATLAGGETLASTERLVTTTGSTSSNTISWATVTGATGYNVYYSVLPGLEMKLVQLGNVTSFVHTTPAAAVGLPPVTDTTSGSLAGNSGQLQIYKGGAGTITVSGGTAQFSGVIHAPYSTLTTNGKGMHYTGSLVVDTYVLHGQPDFSFDYSPGAATVTRDWAVGNYQEIPSSQVP